MMYCSVQQVGYSLKLLSSLFLQKRKLKEATALLEEVFGLGVLSDVV